MSSKVTMQLFYIYVINVCKNIIILASIYNIKNEMKGHEKNPNLFKIFIINT